MPHIKKGYRLQKCTVYLPTNFGLKKENEENVELWNK